MKRLVLLSTLSLASCSLFVLLTNAKRCKGQEPFCDEDGSLVICDASTDLEGRQECDACTEAEGCIVCGDGSLDVGELCFEEAQAPLLLDLPPKALIASNFNNDPNQNADVLVLTSNGDNNGSQFFVGFGGGQFGSSQSTFLAVDDPVAIEAINFDQQDGPDIIYSNSGGNGIETFLSSPAAPHFFSQQTETSEPTAQDLALADIDGDSLIDAIVACSASRSFSIIRQVNTAERILGARANFPDESSVDPGRFLVEASDFDGDGDPDLAFATPSAVQLMQTTDSGLSFVFRGELPFTSISAMQLIVSDEQGDALLIVDEGNQVKRLDNVGSFEFEESTLFTTTAPILFMLVDDLDGDGAQDIIVGLNNNTIEVYRGDGGAFPGSLSVGGAPVAARAAHLDDDGRLDLLVASLAPAKLAPSQGIITIFLSSD